MNSSESPVALISGGASGIGAACATALARQGVRVAVNYRSREDEAAALARQCSGLGAEAITVQGDVADDDDCRRMVEATLARWQRLDLLINNAGITRFGNARDLSTLQRDDFEAVYSVNVVGAYQLTRAAEAALRESPSAAIVNVSSHSGFSGMGSSMAYAASKGALNTLTRSLARNLAPAIRVNGVAPGFVGTQWMAKRMEAERLQQFFDRVAEISPLGYLVTADDVADAVVWLALRARGITGQLLVIDSGTHLTVADPLS